MVSSKSEMLEKKLNIARKLTKLGFVSGFLALIILPIRPVLGPFICKKNDMGVCIGGSIENDILQIIILTSLFGIISIVCITMGAILRQRSQVKK